MKGLLLVLQLIFALGLILAILMHAAKGEGLGGIGGTARLFGTQKGLEDGLNKITSFFAVAFVACSLVLGIIATK